MNFEYEKTDLNLYRAIFFDNYSEDVSSYLKPDEELANAEITAPILHPTWTNNGIRPADIKVNLDDRLYHPNTGGTSTFDRANVLRRADGDFLIPEGTPIPPDLIVQEDGWSKRLKATHHTIMPSKPMSKNYLKSQLDNFVRSAIAKQYENARGN
mgnify:CR=1 FL=1